MAAFGDLIGAFMRQALPPCSGERIGNALQQLQRANLAAGTQAPTGGGALGGILNALQTGTRGATAQTPQASGLGALAGALLGGGGTANRGNVGGNVGGNALALLAGVAVQALQQRANTAAQAPTSAVPDRMPTDAPPLGLRAPANRDEEAALEAKARLLLKGMINAAKADGQISEEEMRRILAQLDTLGQDPQLHQWVLREMAAPINLPAFAAEIPDLEVAAEVYAASLLAIEVDTDEERAYLRELAAATGLSQDAVARIHQMLGVAR